MKRKPIIKSAVLWLCLTTPFSMGADESDLSLLKRTKQCQNGQLSGVDLANMDLRGYDLRGSCLVKSNLENTHFTPILLYSSDMRHANVHGTKGIKEDFLNFPGRILGVQYNNQIIHVPDYCKQKLTEYDGEDQNENIQRQVADIQQKADLGSSFHQFLAGFLFESYASTKEQRKMAKAYYEKAADQAYWPAINNLGWLYERGYGCKADIKKAVELYQQASLHHPIASFNLTRLEAKGGDREACYSLGAKYKEGRDGVPEDLELAHYWMKQAADQGHIKACRYVGMMYRSGSGTKADDGQAFFYLQRGADPLQNGRGISGDPESQYELGTLYEFARGTPQNYQNARFWYEKASEIDHTGALMHLGMLYEEGKGGPVDFLSALRCYGKVGAQGRVSGLYNQARMYSYQTGEENAEKTVYLCEKVLEKDPSHADALFLLATSLQKGKGVIKDVGKAVFYYEKAAQNGHCLAKISASLLKNSRKSCDKSYKKYKKAFSPLFQPNSLEGETQVDNLMPIFDKNLFDKLEEVELNRSFSSVRLPLIQDFSYVGLSIDGGGIRGKIPANFMSIIEEVSGKRIHQLFDYVGGTSVGGILALGLTATEDGHSPLWRAQDFVTLFDQNGEDIFPKKGKIKKVYGVLSQLWTVQYSSQPLENILKKYCKDLKLSQTLLPALVTAMKVPTSEAVVFDSRKAKLKPDDDFLMWQVARSTSAAPTYFKSMTLQNITQSSTITVVDGGVWQNNPADYVHSGIIKTYRQRGQTVDDQNVTIVSLGTGQPSSTNHFLPKRSGIVQAIPSLLSGMMAATSDGVNEKMKDVLGDRYIRLQPVLKKSIDLADTSEKANQRLETAANSLRDKVEEVARLLAENSDRKQERV